MSRGRRALLAVLTGLMLALAFPWFNLWILAWVALLPLLVAVRGIGPRRAFWLGWLAGFSFYLLVLFWICPTVTNYTRIGPLPAAVILGLLCAVTGAGFAVFTAVVEWLAAAGISRVLSAPIAWVVIEWLRSFFPAAFPWALLGYSQLPALAVVQVADLTGVYGVSAVLLFANAAIAELARNGIGRHRRLAAALIVVVTAVLAYGTVRLATLDEPAAAVVAVGIAQGNIPQDRKWDDDYQNATLDQYLALSRHAVERGARLVVWPEAAVPFFVNTDPRAGEITRFARSSGSYLLVGAPGYENRDGRGWRSYNQAWLVAPGRGFEGPYDKIQLVPFGEYVPFGGLFGLVNKAVEGIGDFGRGQSAVVFDGPTIELAKSRRPLRFGVLICYEGIFPSLVRRFVAAGADVLVNISNDAWYGRTSAPYQHLAMVALRAVENRVPVVRATNTGISALIDRSGRVHDRTALFTQATLVEQVPLHRGRSLYARVGDLFVYLCLAGLALLAYLRVRLGRLSRLIRHEPGA